MALVDNRGLRKLIKPFVPPLLAEQNRLYSEAKQQREKRAKLELFRSSVSPKVSAIRSLTPEQCLDAKFLEREFIPSLGLNNESLYQFPAELHRYCGTGLHIWQYPSQLAKLLVWLSENAKDVKCYMEIGCRWGGMFILISEWLRKHSADMQTLIAVDLMEPTPLIDEYFKLVDGDDVSYRRRVEPIYIRNFSTSIEVRRLVERIRPDFVFIDADHSLKGALADHMLVRDCARIIVHHDVASDSCPDTTMLWNVLNKLECHGFSCLEFIDQYGSVKSKANGFGVLSRKTPSDVARTLAPA